MSARDLSLRLARRIADGELAAGDALPSARALAADEGVSAALATRAYALLASAGVVVTSPRRAAHVAPGGALEALRLLRGGRPLRLAGSDDPALDIVLDACRDSVEPVAGAGSGGGLTAIWKGAADAAAVHLWHVSGTYNGPYARALLDGREPVLVHLWRREQGLLLPPGNPAAVGGVRDLARLRVAVRQPGAGTRVLLERLLREAGVRPGADVVLDSHLGVALAVASGVADAGVAVRAAATAFALDFRHLAWEPFEIAVPAAELGGLAPLLAAAARPDVAERIVALGGYDLSALGQVERV
jgi:molybdate-binding protein